MEGIFTPALRKEYNTKDAIEVGPRDDLVA